MYSRQYKRTHRESCSNEGPQETIYRWFPTVKICKSYAQLFKI